MASRDQFQAQQPCIQQNQQVILLQDILQKKCEHAIFGSYVLLFKNCYLHAKLLVLTSVQGSSYENEEFCSTCLASHTHAVNLPRGISLHKNAQPYDQETWYQNCFSYGNSDHSALRTKKNSFCKPSTLKLLNGSYSLVN